MSERYAVYWPNGIAIDATISPSEQEAIAKALRMDIPPGCRADRYFGPAPPPDPDQREAR